MNLYGFEPDFTNLKKVLSGHKGDRVPMMEFVIDQEIKDTFMGKPVKTLEEEIEFRCRVGYDYAWISTGMIDPAGTVNEKNVDKSEKECNRPFVAGNGPIVLSVVRNSSRQRRCGIRNGADHTPLQEQVLQSLAGRGPAGHGFHIDDIRPFRPFLRDHYHRVCSIYWAADLPVRVQHQGLKLR